MICLAMMQLLPSLFDGHSIHLVKYEMHFNVFYNPERGDDLKSIALVVWIDNDGTWRDDSSVSMSIHEVAKIISNQTRERIRVRFVFRDDERNIIVAILQTARLLMLIPDQRRVVVYIDFIPLRKL